MVEKKKELSVIIGAGFSWHAGLPLANGIKDFFIRDNVDKILKFGSGESKWADFANDVYKNNGKLGFDHVAYGYILNCLVKRFVKENGDFTNYEDFYQFLIDNFKTKQFIDTILLEAKETCLKEKPNLGSNPLLDSYLYAFKHTDSSHLTSLINHLISDLLYWRIPKEEIANAYRPFISFLNNYDKIFCTTLNHDLLLEYLIESNLKRGYSDGFSRDQKMLLTEEGKPLNVFTDDFKEAISVIKLHGSIDTYKYIFFTEDKKTSVVTPTGEYLYFKTLDYYEKQHPVRHNVETGEKVQTFHFEITPQFITGTKKENLIASDKMYSSLYKRFEENIIYNEVLLIIGYSYADKHINSQIKIAINKGKLKKVININPGMNFPFSKEGVEISNLKNINELNN